MMNVILLHYYLVLIKVPLVIMFAYSKCESLYINAVKYGIHD